RAVLAAGCALAAVLRPRPEGPEPTAPGGLGRRLHVDGDGPLLLGLHLRPAGDLAAGGDRAAPAGARRAGRASACERCAASTGARREQDRGDLRARELRRALRAAAEAVPRRLRLLL